MRFTAVQPAARYWIYEEYAGHFIAAHLAAAKYEVGNESSYRKGILIGPGVSYGYAWLLNKRWNLTLEAGIGIYMMKDTKRMHRVPDNEDERSLRSRRITLAPSKASAALSYLF